MFSSKSSDHLAFISRQLSNLMSGEQPEAALKRLAEACPPEYAEDIEYLRHLLDGSASKGPSLGPNPYAMLARLVPTVTGPKNRLFRHFVEYAQQSKVIFETYWAGVVGMIWYLAALTVVALAVAVIFGVFVVPSFSKMFAQFGAPMPELTKVVFSLGGTGIPVFAIVVTVLVALVAWFIAKFHRRIQCLAPLPRWPSWTPAVGEMAETYNTGLFLNFTRILLESDVEASRAVDEAAKAANLPPGMGFDRLSANDGEFGQSTILTELGVAARLGFFQEEVAFQCDQHIGRMSLALVDLRDRFSMFLKIILYLFVATLVVAMYLPIFKLGSAV